MYTACRVVGSTIDIHWGATVNEARSYQATKPVTLQTKLFSHTLYPISQAAAAVRSSTRSLAISGEPSTNEFYWATAAAAETRQLLMCVSQTRHESSLYRCDDRPVCIPWWCCEVFTDQHQDIGYRYNNAQLCPTTHRGLRMCLCVGDSLSSTIIHQWTSKSLPILLKHRAAVRLFYPRELLNASRCSIITESPLYRSMYTVMLSVPAIPRAATRATEIQLASFPRKAWLLSSQSISSAHVITDPAACSCRRVLWAPASDVVHYPFAKAVTIACSVSAATYVRVVLGSYTYVQCTVFISFSLSSGNTGHDNDRI